MFKRRVIPVLLLKNGLIVRSETFTYHQVIGDPTTQLSRYSKWQVDELIYLDISVDNTYDVRRNDAKITTAGKADILGIIDEIAACCFAPLTFGGRIRTLEDIHLRLEHGADKVTVNTAALQNPDFIRQAANSFGSQCIVVSIDAKLDENGNYRTYKGGREPMDLDPVRWAGIAEKHGAGEILINSMDRDGTAKGYDLELINRVTDAVSIPVIALGGVGDWEHMAQCLRNTRVSAVAAANKFHFTEMSYQQAKTHLQRSNLPIRKPI